MPILLTTPFNPGDNDPGQNYTHVRISSITIRMEGTKRNVPSMMSVELEHGILEPNKDWTPGKKQPEIVAIQNANSDRFPAENRHTKLSDTFNNSVNPGETFHGATVRSIYERLISDGTYPGVHIPGKGAP
ncbi:MAG: hypothetical protein KAJ19_22210 [Gammaproteobacteria bacterium]|nr:hypothetical protein [Gammaproteobacteria bacterium]